MKNKYFFAILITLIVFSTGAFALDSKAGIVNFMNVIVESKYGKKEQEQLENIKKQWSSLIEETEKELKDIQSKLDDQNFLDGISPEKEEELKLKQQTLNQDIAKYQNQLYQILNQANYYFIQKISNIISKTSEKIAHDKKIDVILNKEACFFSNPKLDITDLVIKEMDVNFDKEMAKNEQNAKAAEQLNNEKKAG